MTTLDQRFAELQAEKPEISQADLARTTGVKPPSVSDWFTGNTKSMKIGTAAKAASLYGVNALWLSVGEGQKYPSPTLVATATVQNQPLALAVPAQVATNSVALSVECQVLCNAMAGLPDDHALRTRVLSDILSIIAKAHDPPSHQESPAYSHAATRAA